jgi:hypothetical protein
MKIGVRARFPGAGIAFLGKFRIRALTPIFLLTLGAHAQTEEVRTLEREDGSSVSYTLRTYPEGAHLLRPDAKPVPTTALDAAKLIILHLSDGDIEEAALLSTSPRRRYEELVKFRESSGEEQFKRLYSQYFSPENRLIAEIAIDRQRLVLWELLSTDRPGAPKSIVTGQFFVEVDGQYLLDDRPNETRSRLHSILRDYQSGKLPR